MTMMRTYILDWKTLCPKAFSQGSQGIVRIFRVIKKFEFCAAREIWIRFIRFIKIQIIYYGLALTDDGMHIITNNTTSAGVDAVHTATLQIQDGPAGIVHGLERHVEQKGQGGIG